VTHGVIYFVFMVNYAEAVVLNSFVDQLVSCSFCDTRLVSEESHRSTTGGKRGGVL
jgi:hypothetical protein